jgi:hypothetical protein
VVDLESRYRYSANIVYNNFPWPEPTDKQRAAIEAAAQGVLDARAAHPGATLADLYDPLTMPPDLVKAHHALDKVGRCSLRLQGRRHRCGARRLPVRALPAAHQPSARKTAKARRLRKTVS